MWLSHFTFCWTQNATKYMTYHVVDNPAGNKEWFSTLYITESPIMQHSEWTGLFLVSYNPAWNTSKYEVPERAWNTVKEPIHVAWITATEPTNGLEHSDWTITRGMAHWMNRYTWHGTQWLNRYMLHGTQWLIEPLRVAWNTEWTVTWHGTQW